MENEVRLVKGHLKTMKACLERTFRKRIPEEHPLMSWLVEPTAWLGMAVDREAKMIGWQNGV